MSCRTRARTSRRRSRRLTGGKGVQVVYDSVGQTTFEKSLNCLAPRGMLVLFGQSSGVVRRSTRRCSARRARCFSRGRRSCTTSRRAPSCSSAPRDLFGWIAAGKLRLRMEFEFPLKDAAKAHEALAGRKTTGKVLLIP